jgi:hypothetical protein
MTLIMLFMSLQLNLLSMQEGQFRAYMTLSSFELLQVVVELEVKTSILGGSIVFPYTLNETTLLGCVAIQDIEVSILSNPRIS